MNSTETKAPATIEQVTSAIEHIADGCSKDTTFCLTRQQKRLLLYLARQTEPKSVVDIIQALGQTDPRGHISRLRKLGYPIADIRCKCEDGTYKRYYLRKEVSNGGIQ